MIRKSWRGAEERTLGPTVDYTCRARWPEGLLCSTISLKSCNLAQILQSPKSEIVTCVMFSTHTNTSLIKPHLTELDEIHRNRPKSNYNLAKNLQSWSVTSDGQTSDRRTEIHTFFIWHPRVGREHNSPSGKNFTSILIFKKNRTHFFDEKNIENGRKK